MPNSDTNQREKEKRENILSGKKFPLDKEERQEIMEMLLLGSGDKYLEDQLRKLSDEELWISYVDLLSLWADLE